MTNSVLRIFSTFLVATCSGAVSFTDSAVIKDGGLASNNTTNIADNSAGIEIQRCVFASYTTGGANSVLVIAQASDVLIEDTKFCQLNVPTSLTQRGLLISNNTTEIVVRRTAVIAPNTVIVNPTTDTTMEDMRVGSSFVVGGATNSQLRAFAFAGCSNVMVDGIEFIGQVATRSPFSFTDCDNVTVRNVGEVDAKVDLGGNSRFLGELFGFVIDLKMQRVFFTGLSETSDILPMSRAATGVELTNVSAPYGTRITADANNVVVRGVHAISGNLGSGTGWNVSLNDVVGGNFFDAFTSDTTGLIGIDAVPPGIRNAGSVVVQAGTPVFNSRGRVFMRDVGDQVTWHYPYDIQGHTGFQNAVAQLNGTNTNNFSYEYQLDTGGGFGAWTTLTGPNLAAETIPASGFRMGFRITTVTANANNQFAALAVSTTTTIADQKANLHSIVEGTQVTLSPLIADSEVRVYLGEQANAGAAVEIAGIESSLGSFSFEHFNPGAAAYIVVHQQEYESLTINLPVSEGGLPALQTTIPVQQQFDRNFSNP